MERASCQWWLPSTCALSLHPTVSALPFLAGAQWPRRSRPPAPGRKNRSNASPGPGEVILWHRHAHHGVARFRLSLFCALPLLGPYVRPRDKIAPAVPCTGFTLASQPGNSLSLYPKGTSVVIRILVLRLRLCFFFVWREIRRLSFSCTIMITEFRCWVKWLAACVPWMMMGRPRTGTGSVIFFPQLIRRTGSDVPPSFCAGQSSL